MTTTAFDDQFVTPTQTILRKNVSESQQIIHDLQVRVKQLLTDYDTLADEYQATCAAHMETLSKLDELREQKPVAWMDAEGDTYKDEPTENWCPPHVPLYASFAHVVHKGARHCDDCGLTWLDDGLNPLGCPYCVTTLNARRYLALRESGACLEVNSLDRACWLFAEELDATADQMLENGK